MWYILWADREMVKDQTLLAGNHHSDEQSADNNPKLHSSMSERSSGYHTSGKQCHLPLFTNYVNLLHSVIRLIRFIL